MTRLMLVRHGQASFGAADYDQLSDTGYAQARHLGAVMRAQGEAIASVWHGPMLRHRQTAEAWVEAYGAQVAVHEHTLLGEFDHREVIACYEPRYRDHSVLQRELAGSNAGLAAFATMFKEALSRWQSEAHDADYIETWPQFQTRCTRAFQEVAAQCEAGKTHLVVTSGGVISAIAQQLLGLTNAATMALNWNLANAGVTCIQQATRGDWMLVSLNEHAHFRGDQRQLLSWR